MFRSHRLSRVDHLNLILVLLPDLVARLLLLILGLPVPFRGLLFLVLLDLGRGLLLMLLILKGMMPESLWSSIRDLRLPVMVRRITTFQLVTITALLTIMAMMIM